MSEGKLFLAADSGGSKTDWALTDESGNTLYSCQTQGLGAIKEGVLPVLQTVQEAHAQIEKIGSVQSIYLSLGGPNVREVEDAIKYCWQNIPVCVEREARGNAMLTAAKFLGCSAVVMCGTGSVAMGDTQSGRKYGGGWGPVYGDGGSGGGLGSDALRLFLRAIDNRTDIGGLKDIFSVLTNGLDITQFDDRMELKNRAVSMSRRDLAALIPDIYRLAESGDKTALQLFEKAAKEIAELATYVSDNSPAFKILLCGGFFVHKPILLDLCYKEFAKKSFAQLKYILDFSPIVAAKTAVLQQNNIQITEEIFENVRRK